MAALKSFNTSTTTFAWAARYLANFRFKAPASAPCPASLPSRSLSARTRDSSQQPNWCPLHPDQRAGSSSLISSAASPSSSIHSPVLRVASDGSRTTLSQPPLGRILPARTLAEYGLRHHCSQQSDLGGSTFFNEPVSSKPITGANEPLRLLAQFSSLAVATRAP